MNHLVVKITLLIFILASTMVTTPIKSTVSLTYGVEVYHPLTPENWTTLVGVKESGLEKMTDAAWTNVQLPIAPIIDRTFDLSRNSAIISKELADKLNLSVGDTLYLSKRTTFSVSDWWERKYNIQGVSITGIITAEDIGSVNRVVQQRIDTLSLPTGVEVTMGGVMERMRESFSGMFIAIIVAILLAYAVIALTFRSFLKPIIIMVSLPLASIGALVGLLLAGQPLGVSALMGVLMLVGIVLTNAIVLIDLAEKLRKKGTDTYEAIVEAGRTRMRPILMTALTTMIAMLPIAVGLGEGTVLSAELAIVVIGGLFSSTLLTLLVIPVLYSLSHGLRQRIGRRI